MLRIFGLGVLSLAAASCNSLGNRGHDPDSDVKAVADTVYLGMGYDTDSFQTRDRCINGPERIETQPVGTYAFSKVESWETAKREMGFSVEGEYTYGVAKVTAKSSFTRNLQDTDVTSTYLLKADYLGVTKFLQDGVLPDNIIAKFETDDKGKASVRRRCGNYYVSQVDLGGMLRVIVKFRFANKALKENFTFSGSVSAGLNKVETSTNYMNETEKKNSSAEIYIYQEGGDLAHLGEILDPAAAVECSIETWERCRAMIARIMDYGIKTFPADVQAGKGRIYAYKTVPYFDIDFAPLPEEVQAKRTATMVEMEKQDYDIVKVQYLMKDRENQTIDDRKRELEGIRAILNRNVSKLTSNLLGCVEYPNDANRCLKREDLKLETYDPARLVLGSVRIVGLPLGGDGGNPFEQTCRNFMTGAVGTRGDVVDQLAVACDDGRLLATAAKHQADKYYNASCPAGQVVTGIRGDRGKSNAIGSLVFTCKNLAEMRAKKEKPASGEAVIINKGRGFTWDCPAGLAAVGLQGRSDKYVNAVALVCVSY